MVTNKEEINVDHLLILFKFETTNHMSCTERYIQTEFVKHCHPIHLTVNIWITQQFWWFSYLFLYQIYY